MIINAGAVSLDRKLAEFHFDGDVEAAWEYFRHAIDAAHHDLMVDYRHACQEQETESPQLRWLAPHLR